jgi:hypothetical protein
VGNRFRRLVGCPAEETANDVAKERRKGLRTQAMCAPHSLFDVIDLNAFDGGIVASDPGHDGFLFGDLGMRHASSFHLETNIVFGFVDDNEIFSSMIYAKYAKVKPLS